MDQTKDIQEAICILLRQQGEPIAEAALLDLLMQQHPQLQEDPRWIMVAIMRLKERGWLIYPACSHPDHHQACLVQLTEPASS